MKIVYADTSSTEFAYNGLSQRVRVIERDSSNAVTSDERLLWQGNEILQRRTSSTNAISKLYFSEGFRVGSTNHFYTHDHLGSIREVTDSSGTVQARYDYGVWGERTLLAGTDLAEFSYTGHPFHAKSGLHLAWFRAYDAELGRWLNRDPIEELDGPNVYMYVHNSPLVSVDINGLQAYVDWGLDHEDIEEFGDEYWDDAVKAVKHPATRAIYGAGAIVSSDNSMAVGAAAIGSGVGIGGGCAICAMMTLGAISHGSGVYNLTQGMSGNGWVGIHRSR